MVERTPLEETARRNVVHLRRAHLDGPTDPDDASEDQRRNWRQYWSQEAVARRLGTTRQSYQATERGSRGIGANDLCALAYVLDVSPMTLILPQAGGPVRVPVVTMGSGSPLANPGIRRFHAWWRAEKPLGGQEAGFFYRHAAAQHSPATADGRQRGLDRKAPSIVPLREREVEAAHRALDELFRAINDDDADAEEHHRDVLEDCLDRAYRRQAGEIVDTLQYWRAKWPSRRRRQGGSQDD